MSIKTREERLALVQELAQRARERYGISTSTYNPTFSNPNSLTDQQIIQGSLNTDTPIEPVKLLEVEPSGTVGDVLADLGKGFTRGVVKFGDTAVTVLDILASPTQRAFNAVTGTPTEGLFPNHLRQSLEFFGYDPKGSDEFIESKMSDGYKQAMNNLNTLVDDPNNSTWDKVAQGAKHAFNPRLALPVIAQSIPEMLAGGATGKVIGSATKVSSSIAPFVGHGGIASASYLGTRNQEAGKITGKDVATALAIGGVVGGTSYALRGTTDIDTLASGITRTAKPATSSVKNVLVDTGKEATEELIQSSGETLLDNLNLGNAYDYNLIKNALLGVSAGTYMGGGISTISTGSSILRDKAQKASEEFKHKDIQKQREEFTRLINPNDTKYNIATAYNSVMSGLNSDDETTKDMAKANKLVLDNHIKEAYDSVSYMDSIIETNKSQYSQEQLNNLLNKREDFYNKNIKPYIEAKEAYENQQAKSGQLAQSSQQLYNDLVTNFNTNPVSVSTHNARQALTKNFTTIAEVAVTNKVPLHNLLALFHVSSLFDDKASASNGGQGLSGINPDVFKRYNPKGDILSAKDNAEVAGKYFQDLDKKYNNNLDKVYASFYLGEQAVDEAINKARVQGNEKQWSNYIPQEAIDFVQKVTLEEQRYKAHVGTNANAIIENKKTNNNTPTTMSYPTKPSGKNYSTIAGSLGDGLANNIDMVKEASAVIGVNPLYLLLIGSPESGWKTTAKNNQKGQTASGLFQFTQATWNSMMSKYADELGIPKGTSPFDPKANALMGAKAIQIYQQDAKRIGVKGFTETDAYVFHFLGLSDATKFYKHLYDKPNTPISSLVSQQVMNNNKAYLYHKGKPRTVAEVYNHLHSKMVQARVALDKQLKEGNISIGLTVNNSSPISVSTVSNIPDDVPPIVEEIINNVINKEPQDTTPNFTQEGEVKRQEHIRRNFSTFLAYETKEEIDNDPTLTPQEKVILRQLIDIKHQMADLRNAEQVSKDIIDGYKGKDNLSSHLGLKEYYRQLSLAVENNDVANAMKYMDFLHRFADNHLSKASAISEALASNKQGVRIAPNKDGVWIQVPDNISEEAFKKARGYTVYKNNPLNSQINTEANLINEFRNIWANQTLPLFTSFNDTRVMSNIDSSIGSQQALQSPSNLNVVNTHTLTNQVNTSTTEVNIGNSTNFTPSLENQSQAIISSVTNTDIPVNSPSTYTDVTQTSYKSDITRADNPDNLSDNQVWVDSYKSSEGKYLNLNYLNPSKSAEGNKQTLHLNELGWLGNGFNTKSKDVKYKALNQEDALNKYIKSFKQKFLKQDDFAQAFIDLKVNNKQLVGSSKDSKEYSHADFLQTLFKDLPTNLNEAKHYVKNFKYNYGANQSNLDLSTLTNSATENNLTNTDTKVSRPVVEVKAKENTTEKINTVINNKEKPKKGIDNKSVVPAMTTRVTTEISVDAFSDFTNKVISLDELADFLSIIPSGLNQVDRKELITLIEQIINYIPDTKITFSNKANGYTNGIINIDINTDILESLTRGLVKISTHTVIENISNLDDNQSKEDTALLEELQSIRDELVKASSEAELDTELQELINNALNSYSNLISLGTSNVKLKTYLKSIQTKKKSVKSNLFRRISTAIAEFLHINTKHTSDLYSRLLDTTGFIININYANENVKFTKNKQGKLSLLQNRTQEDIDNELAKPFYQRHQFIAYVTQHSNKPLASIENLAIKLHDDLMGGINALTDENPSITQRRQLEDFLYHKEQLSKHLIATFRSKLVTSDVDYRYQDLKSYLINEDGSFDDNVLTALSLASYSWLIENGSKTSSSYDDVKKLLGIDDDGFLPSYIYKQYIHKGDMYSFVADNLGSKALSLLGLKTSENASITMDSRLAMSLGNWIISAMQSAELVHLQAMSVAEHLENLREVGSSILDDDELDTTQGQVNFVSMTDTAGKQYNQRNQEIVAFNTGTKGYLSKLFGDDIGYRYPTDKPSNKVRSKIKKTSAIVSKVQEEFVLKMQQEPIQINKDMYDVLYDLYNQDSDFTSILIGAKVTQETIDNTHVDERESLISGANAKYKELLNAFDFISGLVRYDNGEFKKFYDSVYVAKNNRMHYNSNIFNFQTSKIHRSLAEYANFKTQFNTNTGFFNKDGTTSTYGLFLRAIAENAEGTEYIIEEALEDSPYKEGFTVDKLPSQVFLPIFANYLQTDKTVLNAVASTKKLLNKQLLNQEDKDNIHALVTAWDMGSQSLRALVEYTRYTIAKENNQLFTTSIGLGSDGVNNGSAISYLLTGSATDNFLSQVGFFDKASGFESYFDTRTNPTIGDYYTGLKPILTSVFDSIASNSPVITPLLHLNNNFFKRKNLKAILIPFGYSAGINRISIVVYEQFLKDIRSKMSNIAVAYKNNRVDGKVEQDYQILQLSLQALLGEDFKLDKPEELLEFRFSNKQLSTLKNIYLNTLGDVVDIALNSYAGEFIHHRNQNIAYHASATEGYHYIKTKLEQSVFARKKQQIAEELKDNPKYKDKPALLSKKVDEYFYAEFLSKKEYKEQIADVLAKIEPTVNSAYDFEEQALYGDSSQSKIRLFKETSKLITDKAIQAITYVKAGNEYVGSNLSLPSRFPITKDIGVTGNSAQVQSTDSRTSAQASAKGGKVNINVHDANISGLANYVSMVKEQNKAIYHAILRNHAQTTSIQAVLKVIAGYLKLQETLEDNINIDDFLQKVLSKLTRNEADKTYYKNLVEAQEKAKSSFVDTVAIPMLKHFVNGAIDRDIAKLAILDTREYVHQYAGENGEYHVTADDKKEVKLQLSMLNKAREKYLADIDKLSGKFAGLDSDVKDNIQAQKDLVKSRYINSPQWLKGVTGADTKLTENEWLLVRTPSFKAWFGDWENEYKQSVRDNGSGGGNLLDDREIGSRGIQKAIGTDRPRGKTVKQGAERRGSFKDLSTSFTEQNLLIDPVTGEPRLFFHGTKDDFINFDISHNNKKDLGWLGRGAYITSSEFIAGEYARIKKGQGSKQIKRLFIRANPLKELTLKNKNELSKRSNEVIATFTDNLIKQGFQGSYIQLTKNDWEHEIAVFNVEDIIQSDGANLAFTQAGNNELNLEPITFNPTGNNSHSIASGLIGKVLPLHQAVNLLLQSKSDVELDGDYSRQLLKRISELNPDVFVQVVSDLDSIDDKFIQADIQAGGYFYSKNNILYIYPNSPDWEASILEVVNRELTHSITATAIDNKLVSEELLVQLDNMVEQLKDYLFDINNPLTDYTRDRLSYAFNSSNTRHEMVAIVTAEVQVRNEVRQILGDKTFKQFNHIVRELTKATTNDTNQSRSTKNRATRSSQDVQSTNTRTTAEVSKVSTKNTRNQDNQGSSIPYSSNIQDVQSQWWKSSGVEQRQQLIAEVLPHLTSNAYRVIEKYLNLLGLENTQANMVNSLSALVYADKKQVLSKLIQINIGKHKVANINRFTDVFMQMLDEVQASIYSSTSTDNSKLNPSNTLSNLQASIKPQYTTDNSYNISNVSKLFNSFNPDSTSKAIFHYVMNLMSNNKSTKIVFVDNIADNANAHGVYDSSTNTIELSLSYFNSNTSDLNKQVTLLHELVHAMVDKQIHEKPNSKYVNQLNNMMKHLIPKVNKLPEGVYKDKLLYALSSVNEFVAHGLTDPDVRMFIAENLDRSKFETVYNVKQRLKNFLIAILGLFRGDKELVKNYKTFLKHIDDLAQLQANVDSKFNHRLLSRFNARPTLHTKDEAKIGVPQEDGLLTSKEQNTRSYSQYSAEAEVNSKSAVEVLHELDSHVSDEFNQHLDDLISQMIGGFYSDNLLNKAVVDNTLETFSSRALIAGFKLSNKEAYVNEILLAVIDNYLKANKANETIHQLRKIYVELTSDLKNTLTKEQYAYLYNSKDKDLLVKFISLVLSSENFRDLIDKPRIKESRDINRPVFDRLMSFLSKVINWTTNEFFHIKGKNIPKQIDTLMNKLHSIDKKARNTRLSALEYSWKQLGIITGLGNKLFSKLLDVVFNVLDFRKSPVKVLRQLSTIAHAMRETDLNRIGEVITTNYTKYNQPNKRLPDGLEVLNEVTANNLIKNVMEEQVRFTNAIGQIRSEVKSTTQKALLSLFNNPLSKKDKQIITYVLLRTDISSLLDSYSMQEVIEILSNQTRRLDLVKSLEDSIYHYYADTTIGNDMLMQTKSLAMYMTKEITAEHLVKNAHGIAIGLGAWYGSNDHKALNNPDIKLVKMIDSLASLYALDYTNQSDLNRFNDLMKDDINAIKAIINIHADFTTQAKKDFINNPLNYSKGYLPQITNPYRSLTFAVTDEDIKTLEAKGWVKVSQVQKDRNDRGEVSTLMFHNDIQYQNYVSGALDMANDKPKGTVLYDRKDWEDLQRVTKEKFKQRKSRSKTNYKLYSPEFALGAIALYGTDGAILNYHYEMRGEVRDTYLERNNNFEEILGTYHGNLVFKPRIKDQQANVARVLFEDYKQNYHKDPRLFIRLDPESADSNVQAMWRMMPYSFRKEATSLFGNGKAIVVRASVYNTVFGFREYSVAEMFDKATGERKAYEKFIVGLFEGMFNQKGKANALMVERIIKELVRLAKDIIVIRSGSVLWGNIVANALLLMVQGINPFDVGKYFAVAWRNGKLYQDVKSKLNQVELNIASKIGDIPALKIKRNQLISQLESNPLHDYMQAGLMSTIVEDTSVLDDDTTYKSKFEDKLSQYTNKIPNRIKTGFDWLVLNPNTEGYKFLASATQFSDFGAKYALAQHLQKNGMSFKEAVSQAQTHFINYDVPTSRSLDYMNRIGLFMFTKFFLRFQQVLMNLLNNKAVSVIGQHMLVEQFTNQAGILDPFAVLRLGNNPFEASALSIVGASGDIVTVDVIQAMF